MPDLCIIPVRALEDRTLSPRELRTLLAVGAYTNRHGRGVWASQSTMAQRAGISRPQFNTCVKSLVEKGYLRKTRRFKENGGEITSMIDVILDDPAEESSEARVPESGTPPVYSERVHPPVPDSGTPPVPAAGTPRVPTVGTQTTPINVTASPTPAIASELERFEHADHRAAYQALRTAHRFPVSFDAGLREVHEPSTGGAGYAWSVIGAALVQLQANGETFNVARLRGYCRSHQQGAPRPIRVGGSGAPGSAVGAGPEGALGFSATTLWALWVRAGLTSPMLTREMVTAAVARLADDGAITNPESFTALTLSVEPAEIARISFEKTRLERLHERLADWRRQHEVAA